MLVPQGPLAAEASSRQDVQSALAEAERWMEPATREALVRALMELYMVTARRAEDVQDRNGLIALYARELRSYPGDVALAAIAGYRGKFFPALSELQDAIARDTRLVGRRNVIRAFREFLVSDEPREREICQEERERVRAGFSDLLAKLKQAG